MLRLNFGMMLWILVCALPSIATAQSRSPSSTLESLEHFDALNSKGIFVFFAPELSGALVDDADEGAIAAQVELLFNARATRSTFFRFESLTAAPMGLPSTDASVWGRHELRAELGLIDLESQDGFSVRARSSLAHGDDRGMSIRPRMLGPAPDLEWASVFEIAPKFFSDAVFWEFPLQYSYQLSSFGARATLIERIEQHKLLFGSAIEPRVFDIAGGRFWLPTVSWSRDVIAPSNPESPERTHDYLNFSVFGYEQVLLDFDTAVALAFLDLGGSIWLDGGDGVAFAGGVGIAYQWFEAPHGRVEFLVRSDRLRGVANVYHGSEQIIEFAASVGSDPLPDFFDLSLSARHRSSLVIGSDLAPREPIPPDLLFATHTELGVRASMSASVELELGLYYLARRLRPEDDWSFPIRTAFGHEGGLYLRLPSQFLE